MHLEASWRSACPEGENSTGTLTSANYLHTAISLFGRISAKNGAKLEYEIQQTHLPRSKYLGLPSLDNLYHLSNATSGAEGWDKWREEGIEPYLRRKFEIHDAAPVRADGYDSDRTVTSVPTTAMVNNRRNRDSKDSTGSSQIPRKKAHTVTGSESTVIPEPPTLSDLAATQPPIVVVSTSKSAAPSTISHRSQYSMTSGSDDTSFASFSLSGSDDDSIFTYFTSD
jgi:hypothetical protein